MNEPGIKEPRIKEPPMLVAGPLVCYGATETVNWEGEEERTSKCVLSSGMVIKAI